MIRLASVAPRFKHGGKGGIELGRAWTAFESLTPAQRDILRDRHGRWVRVHPDDRQALEKYGLRFVSGTGPLEQIETEKKTEKHTPPTNSKTKAEKADEKRV